MKSQELADVLARGEKLFSQRKRTEAYKFYKKFYDGLRVKASLTH